MSSAPIPPLRGALEAVPVQHDGKPLFLLRDIEGLVESGLALSQGGLLLASLFDGKRTAEDIGPLFAKKTGEVLSAAEVVKLAEQLEKAGLLETPAMAQRRGEILRRFKESPVRAAAHAGLVYPKERLELAKSLGRFFRHPKGPGKELADSPSAAAPPLGLVAPHIDFERGGPAYAWAFQALSDFPPPDLIVALGVAHMSPNSPWVMTPKAYDTPYGAMAASRELYSKIKSCLWYDPQDDEWVHRQEHSLEFAAVWLKHLWKDKAPEWAPILCSSFERFSPDNAPSAIPTVNEGIEKMGRKLTAMAKAGRRIMILAAVDLAHVGPRFGDDLELNAELERKIEAEDRKSLEAALRLDADSFYLSAVGEGRWRKVCGLSALYTCLRLMKILADGKAVSGQLLTYGQAPDPQGGIVSFAGALFPSA